MSAAPNADGAPARRSARSILLVTHSIYPDDIRTEKEALALRDAGFRVVVVCIRRDGQAAREVVEGVEVRRLPVGHKRGGAARYLFEYFASCALAAWHATLLAVARRPAAVQVSNPPDFLVFAMLVPKLLGARVVLDMHEPIPELYASIHALPLDARKIRALAWVEGMATRFADQVITVSEVCRKTFVRRGTPAEKIAVVENVSETALFDPALSAAPAAVAARADGAFRLVYHGTIVPRYGVDVAVRAMAILRERAPEARLDVYGRGESVEELTRLAAELGVADRVAFHGFVDRREVPARIAVADAGIVPYRKDVFTDLVLPTKLFEYAAMEKPVAATSTEAIRDYFGTDDLYLFESEDAAGLARAIEAIRADRAEAAARARRLRERLARATWDAARREYVAVYERMLARG